MNTEKQRALPPTEDYLTRARILKLRWMGLEEDADLLAARHVAPSMRASTIPKDPRQTD
jgi:hypothetical protein